MAERPASHIADLNIPTNLGKVTTLLNAVTEATDGQAKTPVARKKLFVISGINGDTVQLQGSLDGGTTWVQIGADITADGTVVNDDPWPRVRARVSAWAAGTITVKMAE